ncbi:MAG TPA: hypothetical protein VFE57_06665 [Cyclobacteriaceae bacterium]|nr:hypothetical protein [Cyclobacteriaceae bacterium]
MINFILKKAKWVKLPKADSSYIKKFAVAQLNFERNLIEERHLKVVNLGYEETKKAGY